MKMKKVFLFSLVLLFFTLPSFASGGMENLDESDRIEIIEILRKTDHVLVYSNWWASPEDSNAYESFIAKITDPEKIEILIESLSFESVAVAECGFDYTLFFQISDNRINSFPVYINLNCNNISFYWNEGYYVSGIGNLSLLREFFHELQKQSLAPED